MSQYWKSCSEVKSLESSWDRVKTQGFQRLENYLDTGQLPEGETQLFTRELHAELYTLIFDLSNEKANDNQEVLYRRYMQSIETYIVEKVYPSLASKTGYSLLTEVLHRWENHKIYIRRMSKVFSYLDRTYVRRKPEKTVYAAGMSLFKEEVLDKKKNMIRQMILEVLQEDRNGVPIKEKLLVDIVGMYIELDNEKLEFYKQELHKYVIRDAFEYYTTASAEWINTNTCHEYLLKGEAAIKAEKERCNRFLHAITSASIQNGVAQAIFYNRMRELLSKETSLPYMLENDMRKEMKLVYCVFSRIEEGVVAMANMFRLYVIKRGSAVINESGGILSTAVYVKQETAATFIRSILDLNDYFNDILIECFSQVSIEGDRVDQYFNAALKRAFEELVSPRIGKHSFACLLASFCDIVLRKLDEYDEDAKAVTALERVAAIFNYILEKDVFSDYYRAHLARRLLSEAASEELEKDMIAKLKSKCGAQYTDKFEGMLNDLASARNLQSEFCEEFNTYLAETAKVGDIEFSAKVLSFANWPSYQASNILLPIELEECLKAFVRFYEKKLDRRRLTWVPSLGTASVVATFSQTYELQCNTYQACLLLLFNSYSTLSISAMEDLLGLEEQEIRNVISSLLWGEHPLLKKCEVDEWEELKQDIDRTELLMVNENFVASSRQLRLTMPVQEEVTNKELIEKDRSFAVEAAIVRTMKSKKAVAHKDLVMEVMSQLSMFKPSTRMIVERIEHLIEREYIERDGSSPDVYNYMG